MKEDAHNCNAIFGNVVFKSFLDSSNESLGISLPPKYLSGYYTGLSLLNWAIVL